MNELIGPNLRNAQIKNGVGQTLKLLSVSLLSQIEQFLSYLDNFTPYIPLLKNTFNPFINSFGEHLMFSIPMGIVYLSNLVH